MLWGLLLSPLALQGMAATAHSEAFRAWKSEGELNRCAGRTAGRFISLLFAHFSQGGHASSAVATRTPSDRRTWKGNCERTVKSAQIFHGIQ